jgi:hypothetical protein
MMKWFGPMWTLPEHDTQGKNIELLLQIARIEVSMFLDDDIKPAAGASETSASLDTTQQHTLLSCYEIVERSIEFLTLDDDSAESWERLSADSTLRVLDIIREIIAIVMRYVERNQVRIIEAVFYITLYCLRNTHTHTQRERERLTSWSTCRTNTIVHSNH